VIDVGPVAAAESVPATESASAVGLRPASLPEGDNDPGRPGDQQAKRAYAPSPAGLPARSPAGPPGSRPARRFTARTAIPVLIVLLVAAVVLVNVTVQLITRGVDEADGSVAAANPLLASAPATAGGLPRRFIPDLNPEIAGLIAEFTQRFEVITGAYHGKPAAFYREPGITDPVSDQPGWVEYLGYNSPAPLGPPAATVSRLMASLIDTSAPRTSWQVPAGLRGGRARCAIVTYQRIAVSICAWATDGTFGALLSPNADTRGNELAILMRQMRYDFQPG